MGEHSTASDLAPEGKVIKEDYELTKQVSTHVAKYQKEWIHKKKEDDTFNLSKKIREMLDFVIQESEVELPEEVLVDEDEVEEQSGIEVFVTKDD